MWIWRLRNTSLRIHTSSTPFYRQSLGTFPRRHHSNPHSYLSSPFLRGGTEYIKGIADPHNICAALSKDWASVNIDAAVKAEARMLKAVDQFSELGEDGLLPQKPTSWSKTHSYAAFKTRKSDSLKADLNAQVESGLAHLTTDSPRKKGGEERKKKKPERERGGDGGGQKRAKNAGKIIVTGDLSSKAILPEWEGGKMTGNKAPCGQFYRNGATCRWGKDCCFNHTPINNLCSKDQKAWVRKILTTPGVCFNPDLVKASVRDMTLSEAAEE